MRKILGIVVLFVLINVVVVGFQVIPRFGTYWHLIQIEGQLKIDAAQISKLEGELKPIAQHVKQLQQQLDALRGELQSTETEYPNGIPKKIYDEYSAKVNKYNSLIREQEAIAKGYLPKYEDYSKQLELYNSLIDRRDKLKQGDTKIWFLVPRPGAFR